MPATLVRSRRFVGLALRPHRAALDPRFHRRDLRGRQSLALGRHPLVIVGARDAPKHRRRVCFPRNNRRTVVPAFKSKRLRIQPQFALLLFRAVALDAVLLQQWADFLFETGGYGG